MGASQRPFYALQRDLAWFIQSPELRVFHIATGGEERPVVLQQVALAEGHPRNRSPFFVLEDAHTTRDDGWAMRALRVRAIHAARREAMARAGQMLPILERAPRLHADLDTFAAQLQQCAQAQNAVPELNGLMLVLAPAQVDDAKTFARELRALADASTTWVSLRFLVIELGESAREPLARTFGGALFHTECVIDKNAREREARASLAAAAAAPLGASPEIAVGCAGPRDVVAPPRYGQAPRDIEPSADVIAALAPDIGPAVKLLGSAGHQLRSRILGAASALQHGQLEVALRLQGEARDQCYAAGLERLGALLEVARASYLAAAARRKPARAAYDQVAERATAFGFFDLAAQALLGAASLAAIDKDWPSAAVAANRAGQVAERANEPALSIEAYRCAGAYALRAHSEEAAIDRWKRALSIAGAAPADVAHLTSAPHIARALAKMLLDKGADAPAAALLEQAEALERGAGKQAKRASKKAKRPAKRPPTGTEVMTRPEHPNGAPDTAPLEQVKAPPTTPTGTEILSEPLSGDDDVRR